MTRHSLQRRLAALERARTPDGGMYVVDIGDGYVDWHGERIPIDEWQRRYPESVVVDIGGAGGYGHVVKLLGNVSMNEL